MKCLKRMILLTMMAYMMSSEYTVKMIMEALALLILGPRDLNSTPSNLNNRKKEEKYDSLFTGTFYLDSSEGFEEYLEELGVNFLYRKLAMLSMPIITVNRSVFDSLSIYHIQLQLEFQIMSTRNTRSEILLVEHKE